MQENNIQLATQRNEYVVPTAKTTVIKEGKRDYDECSVGNSSSSEEANSDEDSSSSVTGAK